MTLFMIIVIRKRVRHHHHALGFIGLCAFYTSKIVMHIYTPSSRSSSSFFFSFYHGHYSRQLSLFRLGAMLGKETGNNDAYAHKSTSHSFLILFFPLHNFLTPYCKTQVKTSQIAYLAIKYKNRYTHTMMSSSFSVVIIVPWLFSQNDDDGEWRRRPRMIIMIMCKYTWCPP